MSSYRPKIKLNASGETRDLPLDAETLKGKTLDYFASKSEMNSGLANKQNNLNQTQLNAVNSGITSAKVSTYDGYANQIKDKATASDVYSKSEVDSKDANTLNNAKSYTDTKLKTITDNIVKEVICTHQYEITGNTGDEHGLAIEDQQMIIKKIEGQTKVVNGRLVNSNCVLKSSGRNLIDCVLPQINGNQNVVFKDYVYLPKGRYDIFIETNPKTSDTCNIKIGDKLLSGQYTFNTRQNFELDKDYYGPLQGWNNVAQNSVKISIWYGYDYNHIAYEPFKEDIIDGIGSLGQWDYIEGNKKTLTNSGILTLNGNENWAVVDWNTNLKRLILTDKSLATEVWQGISNDFTILGNPQYTLSNVYEDSAPNNSLVVVNDAITVKFTGSLSEFKQYLTQNPIQVVYKKKVPTIVDIDLPSGYAAYNGGLQSQVGDVPYKITKQYNLSQKAQTLANIEIDREQQGQINEIKALNLGWEVIADNMKKYFSGDGTGSTLDTDIQNKMSDMNAIYALTFDASGSSSTDDFITKIQYGTIYLSNQIDDYYGKKVLIGNGSIISRTFGLYVITAIYSDGSLNVLTQDVQKRSSAVYLQTIKKLVFKKNNLNN